MEERESKIQYISSTLNSFNILAPFIKNSEETDSIVESFMQCINYIQKDQKSKYDLSDTAQRYLMTIKEINQTNEDLQAKIQDSESEVSRLQNLISNNNLKNKLERDKINQEKDSAKKEAAKLSSLCVQHLHDSKKHESAYAKLQEYLKKIYTEKDLSIKNSLEVTSALNKQGISLENYRGDEEFIHFIKQGHQSTLKYYSEIITVLINTINDCFNSIKEVMSRLGFLTSWGSLALENPEKFKSEVEHRLKQFQKAMQNVDCIKEDHEFPNSSVPYLKEVLKSYKDVIDSNIFLILKDN